MPSQEFADRTIVPAPLLILSGPSGTGKTTLLERILAEKAWPLRLSVSATTRAKRPGEQDGVHYHFWQRQQFIDAIAAGEFLEHAEVYGNFYGSLVAEVQPFRHQGIGVFLDIDVQGWQQVKQKCPEAISIFVRASSPAMYEQRLRERRTESEADIQKRLAGAQRELAWADKYDYQIINDDLQTALASLRIVLDACFRGPL